MPLAAALTECKLLIHSVNVANVAMVAEVIMALIYPFTWQLPYIPILPKDMMEFLDALLPLLGRSHGCNDDYEEEE